MENIVQAVETAITNAEHTVVADVKTVTTEAVQVAKKVETAVEGCTEHAYAYVCQRCHQVMADLNKESAAANYLTREETEALRGIASRAWHRFVEFI